MSSKMATRLTGAVAGVEKLDGSVHELQRQMTVMRENYNEMKKELETVKIQLVEVENNLESVTEELATLREESEQAKMGEEEDDNEDGGEGTSFRRGNATKSPGWAVKIASNVRKEMMEELDVKINDSTQGLKAEIESVKGNMATPPAVSFASVVQKDILEQMDKRIESSVGAKLTTMNKQVEKLTVNSDKERRAKNIIVTGYTERKEQDIQKRKHSDLKFANDMLTHMGVDNVTIEEIVRLGKYVEAAPHPRAMRITVSKESDKWKIIGKNKELRKATGDLASVYVHPDLNKEDRDKDKALVQELKDKKLAHPGKNWMISRGKIKERGGPARTAGATMGPVSV